MARLLAICRERVTGFGRETYLESLGHRISVCSDLEELQHEGDALPVIVIADLNAEPDMVERALRLRRSGQMVLRREAHSGH